jgi:hypothetical protein
MKVTAIGANSAFATGNYEKVIPSQKVQELTLKIANSTELVSEAAIRAEIDELTQCLYVPKWQSNFLIEFDMPSKRGTGPYRLLIDAGADIRHSLKAINLSSNDIDGIYISHPHNDHIGGIEYFALTTFFNPFYTKAKTEWLQNIPITQKLFLEQEWWPVPPKATKPDLFVHSKVLRLLRRALGPGLDTLQGVHDVSLDTYFEIHLIGKRKNRKTRNYQFADSNGIWTLTPIFAMHVISSAEEMPSYGVSLEHSSGYHVLMPTDISSIMPSQLKPLYQRANRIYMDCETAPFPSGVHPHLNDLMNKMDKDIQKKCLLYHYDAEPEYPEAMFYGTLKSGDSHTYPDQSFLGNIENQ